jgi:hypothetical protein
MNSKQARALRRQRARELQQKIDQEKATAAWGNLPPPSPDFPIERTFSNEAEAEARKAFWAEIDRIEAGEHLPPPRPKFLRRAPYRLGFLLGLAIIFSLASLPLYLALISK